MENFGNIIGYDAIKTELMQICDMLKNKELYSELGAKLPSGVILHGRPGLGKTMMAKAFIAESGLECFVIRKNKSDKFVEHITETFEKAAKKAPSVVFLDDMDKFGNEDGDHIDAEEFVAVQAAIDDVKNCGVFVIATANDIDDLPESLLRAGRFDRNIEVRSPSFEDSVKIIEYYLKNKKISEDVNCEDIAKMFCHSSCAELETIINEAAILAGYRRKDCIEMSDIVEVVLKSEYNVRDNFDSISVEELEKVAYHEAGHAVMSDILSRGSVGLVSLRAGGRSFPINGFVRRWKKLSSPEQHIMISLAGKAAYEIVYGACADGCTSDIEAAAERIREAISYEASRGLGLVDLSSPSFPKQSEDAKCRNETVVYAELERYLYRVKEILVKNRGYLDLMAKTLQEKKTLLASDVTEIGKKVEIIK